MKTSDRNVVVCDFLFAALNCALNFITKKAMMRRHEFVIYGSVGFENRGDPKSRNGGMAEWRKMTPNPKARNGGK